MERSSSAGKRTSASPCLQDRPLLVQFCANDPEKLLEAAKIVAPFCDGVDINFGCPQRIAKKGRGLHSFTSQLNLSAFCMTGGALRDCFGCVQGVVRNIRGVRAVLLCQKRLKLS
jgi:hypothetical protein